MKAQITLRGPKGRNTVEIEGTDLAEIIRAGAIEFSATMEPILDLELSLPMVIDLTGTVILSGGRKASIVDISDGTRELRIPLPPEEVAP